MNASIAGLTSLAPAKLNLFLHLVGRRPDGYHLLQSVFALLDYGDTVQFTPRDDGVIQRVSVLPGVAGEADLVVRAARQLKREAETIAGSGMLGADITVDGKPVGTLFTRAGDHAIAYLRFDRTTPPLTAGDAVIAVL